MCTLFLTKRYAGTRSSGTWPVICRPKKKGGLGIHNLEKINVSLLCKWWWNLESKEGMWQDIVRRKYNISKI